MPPLDDLPLDARPASAPVGDEAERALHESGRRIEQLPSDLEAMTGPSVWQRVEELMHRTLALHGAHPLPVEERVRRAVQQASQDAGADAAIVLVALEPGRDGAPVALVPLRIGGQAAPQGAP